MSHDPYNKSGNNNGNNAPHAAQHRLAADVGGTFTDVATFDANSGRLSFGKTLTTPEHLVCGVETAVGKAGTSFAATGMFLHGTTVAINTLLERTGARTALLTTRGFRDIYEIGRVNRPDAYNLFFKRHEPLIERALRFEIDGRLNATGEVLVELDEEQIRIIARELGDMGVQAVAIAFMHSYRNAAHEARARDIVAEECPQIFVCASHELSKEYREYERTSTVAANAYLGPRVSSYLHEMSDHLRDNNFRGTFLIVQSSGGLFDVSHAERECIRMLESGPAAGMIGVRSLSRDLGLENTIGFDMGGTTAKAGVLYRDTVLMTGSTMIGGYLTGLPIQIPMIDIQEVGTGGGSIARVKAGGALRVGPQSAGASPGPVCYGLGGKEPTVTDANLLLGRLGHDRFLGGELLLDEDAARRAMATYVAQPLSLDVTAAAEGILRIATTAMAHVVRRVTTDRGLDASDFALIAYGGAGPLHAAMVAKELLIAKVIIPHSPGHFSAFGMLAADYRRDYVHTWFTPLLGTDVDTLVELYDVMESEGRQSIHGDDPSLSIDVTRSADMRYVGQEHAVAVELPLAVFSCGESQSGGKGGLEQIKAAFDAIHEVHYGYADRDQPAEIVSLRSSVIGLTDKPKLKPRELRGNASTAQPRITRAVYFRELAGFSETRVFERSALMAGDRLEGPVLIEEYASTTVVHPGDHLSVDPLGNLVIDIERSGR
ncbi:MAG: N-methylhydantoinase A [Gammaproteobacteria bacterium]|jgi:N-methylhydantoinase A